ncbi:MAG: glycosyltransferase WbuB [Gammaproteobacteria bacterium]|nr:glycosyltransferase WbuB [Gammaproteobacteria bacterium]
MRILITGINYSPELTGIGKYTGEMAEWLSANGYEVRVITAPPYYPAWKISGNYSGWRYKKELDGEIAVYRCPLWVPKQPSGVTRLIHLASFAITSLPLIIANALFWKPDIIFVTEPPLSCAPGVLFSSWISRSKSWLHIQDFEVDAAFELEIIKNPLLARIIKYLEEMLLSRFDVLSTISEKMLERLSNKTDKLKKTILFQNWADTSSIIPGTHNVPLKKEIGIKENSIVLLYSGNMGKKQGLEQLVEAAETLEGNDDIVFVLCGDGAVKKDLQKMTSNMANVIIMGLQPKERLGELMNMADIHLLPQKAGAEDLVMPSKLTSMLSSGRPVIATTSKDTQIARVLDGCGLIVEPGNIAELVKNIKILTVDKDLRQKMGQNARKFAENHLDKEKILKKIFLSE